MNPWMILAELAARHIANLERDILGLAKENEELKARLGPQEVEKPAAKES